METYSFFGLNLFKVPDLLFGNLVGGVSLAPILPPAERAPGVHQYAEMSSSRLHKQFCIDDISGDLEGYEYVNLIHPSSSAPILLISPPERGRKRKSWSCRIPFEPYCNE